LQTIDPIFVDFFLPQQQMPQITLGQKVSLTTDAFPGLTFSGKVSAINPKVDPSTRNIQVEASVGNAKRQLLPGMFANVRIDSGNEQRYLTLPQTAITYNPYGDTVFLASAADPKNTKDESNAKQEAKDAKAAAPALVAQQVFVTVGATRGDQVAIVKGIERGAQVVTSGQVKLKNGTPLVVDNRVQPANNPNPTPQEK